MFDAAILSRIRGYRDHEEGVATEWSIMWTVIFLVLGGLSIDTAYALRTHQLLQASADSASAAGAVALWEGGAVDTAAIEYARYNMPRGLHGNVLTTNDVFVGTWDHVNKVFTTTQVNPDAVKVQTRRTEANGNALPTLFLGLIGFRKFDIASESVTNLLMNPACLEDGIIANGRVDIGGNNSFDQFCVHGYQGIDIQSGNTFGSYTAPDSTVRPLLTVGHPYDAAGKALPKDQWLSGASYASLTARNPGVQSNLGTRPGFTSRAAERVGAFISGLYDPANPDPNFTPLSQSAFSALDQDALNGSYYVNCYGGQTLTIDPLSKVLRNATIVTNCKVKIEETVTMANVIIATTRTGRNAVKLEENVSVGADVCDEASGTLNGTPQPSSILSMGDVNVAAGLKVYGSRIITAANMDFTAGDGGLNGASIQADGNVYLSSGTDFRAGPCKVPLDDNFKSPYWRIVR